MKRPVKGEGGFTLVELMITSLLLGTVAASILILFITLVHSAIVAKREAVGLTLATNQMEYLKSLPYNSLAVAGGSIYATTYLPASSTQKINGVTYTIKTNVSYIDDAYDGCGSYPTPALKQTYCRNYPPPASAPATDTNPADYKILDVTVLGPNNNHLAELSNQVSARVAETASTTGALFVSIIDQTGAPITSATVNVVNSTVTPTVNLTDTTDENGVAIFYGLPPDSGTDYVITGSLSNYSTLTTISSSGSLQPTYPSQKIITQTSSYVTLVLKLQGQNSLLAETTDTSGNPLANVKLYVKGGYKRYTAATDFSYYYDNYYSNYNSGTVSDTRPTTDASGFTGILNLPPINSYLFCNSDANTATTNCAVGATKYYLAAAVPYGGTNNLSPISVPIYDPSNPPATTFTYGTTAYLQKVRLMLTTSSTFPRVYTMNPYDISVAGTSNLNNLPIVITGYNLTSASAKLTLGSTTYNGSGCTSSTTQLTCKFNLTGITTGTAQLSVTNSSGTLTLPYTPQLGGLLVTP